MQTHKSTFSSFPLPAFCWELFVSFIPVTLSDLLFAVANWPGRDMKWLKITLFPRYVHIERVTEQKSRAEARLVAHANQPGSQKKALAGAGCGSAGRSLITSTLNIECLLLPPQNAGAGLPAGEEILKSNSAEWDRVAFWVSFGCLLFSLKLCSIVRAAL